MRNSLDVSAPGHPYLIEYWLGHVTFELLYVMFRFSTKICCRGVPCFANDCPWCFWCRGLNTCRQHVGPLFENQVWDDSGFASLIQRRTTFTIFLLHLIFISMPQNMKIVYLPLPYFRASNSDLFLHSTLVISFYIHLVMTLYIESPLNKVEIAGYKRIPDCPSDMSRKAHFSRPQMY